MQDYERSRASQWLREMRGTTSQAELAADITARTGWSITRDRYSKYESGSLPFGREVLGHFVGYWAARGKPGPDMTPPQPVLSLEERAVVAAERQAAALEFIAWTLSRQQGPTPATPEELEPIQTFVSGLLGRIAPRLPTPDLR